MTLNGVMAVAMRYFTEFYSFPGALRKSGCSDTDTFCDRLPSLQYYLLIATFNFNYKSDFGYL